MPNPVELTAENPEELLDPGLFGAGALFRLQWSATQTGTFADVAGVGSTPTITIVAGQRVYPGKDPAGTDTTWYRARFESLDGTRASSWKGPFQVRLDLADDGSADICSIYDAKQRLGIPATETSEDENLLEYIRQASAFLQGETGRLFARTPASGTTTFLFDVRRPTTTIFVPKGIAEISLVEFAPLTGGTFTSLAAGDWFDDPPDADRQAGWPATSIALSDLGSLRWFYPGKRVVRATMAMGWEAVPADVQAAALDLVVVSHQARGAGGIGAGFTINIDGSRTFERLPDSVRRVISYYRVPNVA